MRLVLITQIEKSFSSENNTPDLLCHECKNAIISDSYTGDTICESCGLVISEKALDLSNFEKNMFSFEEMRDRARTGITDLLFAPRPYFNTVIKRHEMSNYNFKRIAKLDNHNNDSGVRNLLIAIRTLKIISGKLKLSYQVKSHAMLLYRKALKKGLIRGRSIDGMICACLYFACRKFKIPVPFQEIVNESDVKEKTIKICLKALIKELNLKLIPLGPEIFVSRYINNLKLSPEIERKVLETLSQLKGFVIGKNPKVVCAGLIYLICKKNKINYSQVKISKIVGVSEVSLRYTWKQIESLLIKKT